MIIKHGVKVALGVALCGSMFGGAAVRADADCSKEPLRYELALVALEQLAGDDELASERASLGELATLDGAVVDMRIETEQQITLRFGAADDLDAPGLLFVKEAP